jgi:hypothetical protein
MKIRLPRHPELVALALAVLVAVACAVGLAVALGAPSWVLWGFGLGASTIVAVRLSARALDERTIRGEAARHAPEPPHRPSGDQL